MIFVVEKTLLFLTTNINKGNIYCDVKGKICNLSDNDHYLVVAGVRERLLVSKWEAQKINEVEIREQYQHKSQTGLQLQITEAIAGYKKDLENIRGNSKTSAKDR